MIFVTGWNEWYVTRREEWNGVPNGMMDEFNDEYSRDIEPSTGDLKDHYYYQLVNFVRQYKGCRPIPTPSAATTIDITQSDAQWAAVEPYYAAYQDKHTPNNHVWFRLIRDCIIFAPTHTNFPFPYKLETV